MMRPPRGLASRLMVAQLLVIATGALTMVVASVLVAPALFSEHLTRTGEESPQVQEHAEEAFASSFAISLAVAMVASLTAAGMVSWFMVRRVARPVVALADAADAVAAGDYSVTVPTGGFGSELTRLVWCLRPHGQPARRHRCDPHQHARRPRPRAAHSAGDP